jgi:hypothetical protein
MANCVIDGRPTELRLCTGCLDALKAELRAIPDLVEQLNVTLTRQARIGERNGPRSTETPLPYHAGASVDLEALRDTLHYWCKTIAEKRGVRLDADIQPDQLSRWLLRYPTEAAQLEDAAELFENIHSMTKTARRTIDLAPDRRFLGPCDECGAELYIWCTPNRIPDTVYCATEECSFSARVEERRGYLLEKAYNQLMTAAEMSRAIRELVPGQTRPISANTISQWAARGLSTTDGRHTLTKYRHHPKEQSCQCNPMATPPEPCRRPRFLVVEVIEFARHAMGATNQRKESA